MTVVTDLVARGAELERVATGFTYTEGPVWDCNERLLFHDIPSDRRYAWSETEGLVVIQEPTQKANGMARDFECRILICESSTNRLIRQELDGSVTVLAERYRGKDLNSPNDIAVRGNGDVYFSDPAYGRIPVYGRERPRDLDFQGLFRVRATDGALELVATDCEQPNGLVFSDDGSHLYVDDCEHGTIWRYDLADDGEVLARQLWHADAGTPLPFEDCVANEKYPGYVDGMGCDERDNVYVTSRGGILVIGPDGENVGLIGLPEEVGNFTWGGPEGRDLFVCCRSFVGRMRMSVRASDSGRKRLG